MNSKLKRNKRTHSCPEIGKKKLHPKCTVKCATSNKQLTHSLEKKLASSPHANQLEQIYQVPLQTLITSDVPIPLLTKQQQELLNSFTSG
jgi:hypothetical protein